jgi:hypothetical protein
MSLTGIILIGDASPWPFPAGLAVILFFPFFGGRCSDSIVAHHPHIIARDFSTKTPRHQEIQKAIGSILLGKDVANPVLSHTSLSLLHFAPPRFRVYLTQLLNPLKRLDRCGKARKISDACH